MELFARDKSGRPRVWRVAVAETDEGAAIITRSYGLIDGKITSVSREIKKGKNIGRSNETTPIQQATSEAKSLYDKQINDGYTQEIPAEDAAPLLFPMLAHNWEDREKYVIAPFYVQPKLDGVRMLVGKFQGSLIMISRTGKTVHHLDHIRDELQNVLQEGEFLDGESYNHSKSFEDITGLCRTTLDKSAQAKNLKDVEFHVFDCFRYGDNKTTFQERYRTLQNIFKKNPQFKWTQLVPTYEVTEKDQVELQINPDFVRLGYEGTIIRNKKGTYQLNERSNNLLKYKSFFTEEYKITGAEEAGGRDKGTVIWVCETSSGQKFRVRPRGTQEERKQYWSERGRWTTGQYRLTVQYQNTTNGGVPRFPVGLAIRNYE
jgi:DNA ligase-1